MKINFSRTIVATIFAIVATAIAIATTVILVTASQRNVSSSGGSSHGGQMIQQQPLDESSTTVAPELDKTTTTMTMMTTTTTVSTNTDPQTESVDMMGGPVNTMENLVSGDSDDQQVIQSLIMNRDKIARHVTITDHGVSTRTWSNDDAVAGWIQQHVAAMKERLESGNRIRQRDPLFRAVFDHAAGLDLEYYFTAEDGSVHVNETANTPCGVDIIQAHAQVVSGFIEKGQEEVRLKHAIPDSCT